MRFRFSGLAKRRHVGDRGEHEARHHVPAGKGEAEEAARRLLENYRWPGNIRELKNVAEQVSVLSEKRLLTAEDFIKIIPNMAKRNLPMLRRQDEQTAESFQERELLFKFLFDMKNDLNDLKGLIYELVRRNDLEMPDTSHLRGLQSPIHPTGNYAEDMDNLRNFPSHHAPPPSQDSSQPIIINHPKEDYEETEVVEESLSLVEMEKELISKALKKHNNRRKEAAEDLGISERTLYRKIKEYELG